MKQCPKCNKKYRDYDQYCRKCNYTLKYIEGTEIEDYAPEPVGSSHVKVSSIICPYCKSNNTEKISALSKIIVGTFGGIFGLARMSKQFHCNNCGADF